VRLALDSGPDSEAYLGVTSRCSLVERLIHGAIAYFFFTRLGAANEPALCRRYVHVKQIRGALCAFGKGPVLRLGARH
jgi:hypothetical protein